MNNVFYEKLFKYIALTMVIIIVIIFSIFFVELVSNSLYAFLKAGLTIIVGSTWNPVKEIYGGLPFIYGTLYTSILALIIAVPLSLGVAIASSELLPSSITNVLNPVIEMMAAIPSIIYGMWALFVLGPILRIYIEPFLSSTLGFLPLFRGPITGLGYLNAAIVLSIMILPIISSLMREAIGMVPKEIEELTLALGGTRWEAIKMKIHVAKLGILGGMVLGFSRAVGETMAILLVIGNKPSITLSLFSSGATIATVIANEYPEAIINPLHASALTSLALILFVISVTINVIFIRYIRSKIGVEI